MDDLDLGATIKGFSPGQKIFGRYTLKAQLGRGGMGVVWRARDESLERDVAIKMLPEVVANDPSAVRDLKRETAKSQQLSHPHILRIYDFVEAGHLCGITMELVEGGTLTAKRLEQPGEVFTVAALQTWVGQLCEALDYAHSREKIVHRDLKPANLMLTADGQLKVADFGIAASVSDSVSRVSQQAGSSGTPVYMSPQQMMGEKPAVSDDIYALGATLYELLTGKPPFYSGNIIIQVQNKVPPSVTDRRAELGVTGEPIPPEWEQTIAACLAKEPKDRPQSAGEVLEKLRMGEGGLRSAPARNPNFPADSANRTDTAKRATPVASDQSAVRHPKSALAKLAIAGGVAGLALAGWYFGMHAPEQRRLETERQRAEQVRIESERQQAEAIQIAAEREAETRRIEAARLAAEQEAERQRLATARGGIIVRTTPAGAEVRVGAVALDKSPLNLKDQRLGKYPVRIRLAGYEDWDGEIEVRENEFAELNVPLVRSTGVVTLTSEPAGLDFTIKGEVTRTGRTPAELSLPTGRYDVTFRREGWPEQKQVLEVKRDERTDWAVEFVPGSIELVSSPSGVEVWSGEKLVGTTPYQVSEALIGRYDFELRRRGFKSTSVGFDLVARQQSRHNVVLQANVFSGATKEQPFENTLGMRFVPIPGTKVLFSVWETRVQDFEAFVRDTNHDATQGMNSIRRGQFGGQYGDTWKSPGFAQGPTHPVAGVNLADAEAFSRWLTEKERKEGILGPDQEYRLPTHEEWDVAVGPDKFPWGNQWPPPRGAGNYSDATAKRHWTGWKIWWAIDGYDDGYAGTAPVGSFSPNRYGLYDMGGNVWERVIDGGLRGGGFATREEYGLIDSNYRLASDGQSRDVTLGFRLVIAAQSER